MREVKFKGERLDNGEWIFGDLIENQGRFFIYHATNETTIEDSDNGRISIVAVEVDPSTVGQYTGMKDKNGKEIYERYILRIYYDDGDSSLTDVRDFGEIDYYTDDSDYTILAWFDPEKCEVIGNIHDNPELLKGGQR